MKVTTVIAGAITIVGAYAAATTPDVQASELQEFCLQPGQPCEKVKRAADAAAAALAMPAADAEAEAGYPWKWRFCIRPGQVCRKAKRHADAMASAIADAYAAAGAEASELALNSLSKRDVEEPVSDEVHAYRVKRAADAIAEALAAPEAVPEPGYRYVWKWRFCIRPGQVCRKAKRAADALADVAGAATEEMGL